MVVVIVLLFTICWGPIQFFILFQGFYINFQANYETYKIKTWANCMSYANSSINPIVYAFMGESFRKSFKKAFPFMFRKRVRDSSVANGSRNAEMKFVTEEKQGGGHAPIYTNGAKVEIVKSIKFLGVTVTNNLAWSTHINVDGQESTTTTLLPQEAKEI
eukprot:g37753.t1